MRIVREYPVADVASMTANTDRPWARTRLARLAAVAVVSLVLLLSGRAVALEAVTVDPGAAAVDLSRVVDYWPRFGDRIQVSTAPGPDGIVRRIEVRGREQGRAVSWVVFALRNDSDEQLDRLLVAPHYRLVGSGLLRPDLGSSRIADITPSQGFKPEREQSVDADVFFVTLDPGSVVTFVVELDAHTLPQLRLWQPDAYKDNANSFTLYQGMVLGIAGLLALFLTILFVVKGTLMFPAAAALAWTVLAYLCIDFGFWHKLFDVAPGNDQSLRAGAEAMLAATLLVFCFSYLSVNRWHVRVLTVALTWLVGLLALVGVAIYDAPLASGIARISLPLIAVFGFALIVFLAMRGSDRAILLVPTWLFLLAWIGAGWLAITGRLDNDLVAPALNGGLVLLVLLVGLTVMQHAFAGGALGQGIVGDFQRKALALIGSGYTVFDWEVPRDRVFVGAEVENRLGLKVGALEGSVRVWLATLHAADRDRFRMTLDTVVERARGRILEDFRLRSADGHYLWFRLRARPILGSDGEVIRVVGTLADVTDQKTAEERLLHDAVHDNLTGLPNRHLFIDRLEAAVARARAGQGARPTVMVLDLDRFRQVNDAIGMAGGDGVLLTIARRLQRALKPDDTVARLSGDQFGLILVSETEPGRIGALTEALRKAVRAPLAFGQREITITGCIGLTGFEGGRRPSELLEDAEIAMRYAKRIGPDRVEAFRKVMRTVGTGRLTIESDLRRAIERNELSLAYQPVVRLIDKQIVGFEALLRWSHPQFGEMNPREFIEIAEENGFIHEIGSFALDRAARDLGEWQRGLGGDRSLFVSVNVSSRQLIRHDLINDVKSLLARHALAPGSLRLEITESLVMENPEFSAQMLSRIRDLGAGLSLDDFGTGYSSLAYLQRFPFDTVKVDRSFVRSNGSGTRPTILRSIIALAHDLGMEVVAEGAETDDDAAELQALGCEYVQGFLFGAPMPAETAQRLVAENRATVH